MSHTRTLRDNLAVYFRQRPNVWIDGVVLESIAGRYAWRTRTSELRTQLGMDIQNRQRRQTDSTGKRWTTSEYLFKPNDDEVATRTGELDADPSPQHAPTVRAEPHDLNEAWSLR